MRSWACWAISAPWSQVSDRRSCPGSVVIVAAIASRTASVIAAYFRRVITSVLAHQPDRPGLGLLVVLDRHERDILPNFGSMHKTRDGVIYNDAIARGKDHPHAVRILARAWLYVIWDCWHHRNAYDPARHRALQHLLTTQDTAAPPTRLTR